MRCAFSFALLSAGNNMLARIAMMAITTSSSINVNAVAAAVLPAPTSLCRFKLFISSRILYHSHNRIISRNFSSTPPDVENENNLCRCPAARTDRSQSIPEQRLFPRRRYSNYPSPQPLDAGQTPRRTQSQRPRHARNLHAEWILQTHQRPRGGIDQDRNQQIRRAHLADHLGLQLRPDF